MTALRAGTRALLEPATLYWAVPVAVVVAVPLLLRDPRPLAVLPLVVALAVVAVIDLRTRLIPDAITLPALAWALGVAIVGGRAASAIGGMCVAGGLVWLLAVVLRGGIGGGDVKLAAVLGAALGWESALLVLALSQLVAGAFAVVLLLLRRGTRRTALPIGGVIAILGALTIVAGS